MILLTFVSRLLFARLAISAIFAGTLGSKKIKRFSNLSVKTLAVTLFAMILQILPSAEYALNTASAVGAPACVYGANTAATDLTLTPSQGKNFYVDYGATQSPKVDASYIGYRLTNSGASALSNYWIEVSNFVGASGSSYLGLASAASSEKYQISHLPAGNTKAAYFLIKDTHGITASNSGAFSDYSQDHTVSVYSGNPSLGGSLVFSCVYSFQSITDVIASNANKVNTISVDKANPSLGELVTVTVNGDPGTTGAGDTSLTGDGSVAWFSPAAYGNFPSHALRLETTQIHIPGTLPGGCANDYYNQLLIYDAETCIPSNPYTATYTFRVIAGVDDAPVPLFPIGNISSGTQIKHTAIPNTALNSIDLRNIGGAADLAMSKTVLDSTDLAEATIGETTYLKVPYRVTVTSSSATTSNLDLVKDVADSLAIIDSGTDATYTDESHLTSTTIVAEQLTSPVAGTYYFTGPFSVNSAHPLVLNYTMLVPKATHEYTNSVYGFVGDSQISSTSQIVINTDGTVNLATPTATTSHADTISISSAKLYGSYTVAGDTTAKVFFLYSPSLNTSGTLVVGGTYASPTTSGDETATAVTYPGVDGDTNTVVTLNGTPATQYWYRIVLYPSTGAPVYGAVLTFTTPGNPTVSTTAATSISGGSATLNGTVNLNGSTGNTSSFVYGTNSNLSGGTTACSGTSVVSSSAQSCTVTGLAPFTTYYFRIVDSSTNPVATVNGSILSFTTSGPAPTTNAASLVGQTTARLNGSMNTGGWTVTNGFVWGTSSDLSTDTHTVTGTTPATSSSNGTSVYYSLSGLTSGTTYYFRLIGTLNGVTYDGTILSFTTTNDPIAETSAATNITGGSAALNGTVDPNGTTGNTASFIYGTNSDLTGGTTVCASTAVDTATALTCTVTGLLPSTTYYFRIIDSSTSPAATVNGAILSFTTAGPAAITVAATNVSQTTARINGTMNTGGWTITNGFVWGTSSDLSTDTRTVFGATPSTSSTNGTPVYYPLTGLTAGVTYYFRLIGVLGATTYSGAIWSFTTNPNIPDPTPIITPTLTWPTPKDQIGPYTLSPSQLNASCSVNGATLVYSPALGTVLAPGTYTLLVTCIPPNGTAYTSASTTVIFKVLPPVTLTWSNPVSQVGPYSLSPTQLNAVCSIPGGTLSYDPALGTVLQPGTYTLKVTCNPPAGSPYSAVTTSVPFTVLAPATLTWSNPPSQVGPYTLSPNELNAVCSIPGGTLTYDPVLGTVLQPGAYTLKVTCNPPAGSPYSAVTTNVPFTVLAPATLTWSNPASQVGPYTLTPNELNAVCSIPGGTLSYDPALGTVLQPGTYTLKVTCNPPAGSPYSAVTASVPFTVLAPKVITVDPPVKPVAQFLTMTRSLIKWGKSPNGTGYFVTIDGDRVCTTSLLQCKVPRLVGPKSVIRIYATRDNLRSTYVVPKLIKPDRPQVIGIVYFDTAKYDMRPDAQIEIKRVAALLKKTGYTLVVISGNTDSNAYDNETLSNNRAKATRDALAALVPGLSFDLSYHGATQPIANNITPEGQQANRRAEIAAWW